MRRAVRRPRQDIHRDATGFNHRSQQADRPNHPVQTARYATSLGEDRVRPQNSRTSGTRPTARSRVLSPRDIVNFNRVLFRWLGAVSGQLRSPEK